MTTASITIEGLETTTANRNRWFKSSRAEVVTLIERFVKEQAVTDEQRRLLVTALLGLPSQLAGQEEVEQLYIHLPLLVFGAIRGETLPALPLAAATSLLYLGLDIIDDLADGDRPAHWQGYRSSEINLAAATLLCALPQLALSRLEASPFTIAQMQQALAEALLVMSAGQQTDLAASGKDIVQSQAVEESVARKSGEEVALFARLAAHLAGALPEVVRSYTEFGRALGTAGQLASDCYDLFTAPYSRDLASGTRTLPIAFRLEKLQGGERFKFLGLLEQAKTDEAAQAEVRESLRRGGELRYAAFRVEVYCQRAVKALTEANPLEPYASYLRSLINELSFFRKQER